MRILRSLAMAFLMYSRVPMPQVEWKDENMAYAIDMYLGEILNIAKSNHSH